MANVDPLRDLEVVGYANCLAPDMLPSIESPVFRLRNRVDEYLVPPYTIAQDILVGAVHIDKREAESLRDNDQLTLLDTLFSAHPGHMLWIDSDGVAHYEPRHKVEAQLARIAAESLHLAEEALERRNFAEAIHYAGVSLRADERQIKPLALQAAVLVRQGDRRRANYMRKILPAGADPDVFELVVQRYNGLFRALKPAMRSPMKGMAGVRPVNQIAA